MTETPDFDRPWRTLGFSAGVPATGIDEVVEAYVQQVRQLLPALLDGGRPRDLALARRAELDHALDTICGVQLKTSLDQKPR